MRLIATIISIALATLSPNLWAEETESVFSYDKERITKAKPWTNKEFQNNPKEFQFAIIGDRTGGANAEGTFKPAIDQINLLQPEFVINVGDMIECSSSCRSRVPPTGSHPVLLAVDRERRSQIKYLG